MYDSAGEPEDRRLKRIKREFNAGVALFYDPDAGLIRGQVKLHRRSPEQFVATYQTDDDEDLVDALVENVRRVAAERDWTIQHGVGGNQALFDALADGSAFDADARAAVETDLAADSVTPADIRAAVDDAGSVDLLVPDYETAAATLAYLRETFERYVVAVTESTSVETIESADVFVRPSRETERVAAGPEFGAWLDRRRVQAARDAFEESVDALASRLDAEARDVGTALAATFDGRPPASELGVRVVCETGPSIERRGFRRTATYGLPGAVLAGALTGVLWPGGLLELGGAVSLPLHFLGLAAVVVWPAVAVAVARVREDPSTAAATAADPIERSDETAAAAEQALGALDRLSGVASAETVREVLSGALGSYGVAVEPAAARRRRRKRAQAVAAAVSLGAGVLAVALVAVGLGAVA